MFDFFANKLQELIGGHPAQQQPQKFQPQVGQFGIAPDIRRNQKAFSRPENYGSDVPGSVQWLNVHGRKIPYGTVDKPYNVPSLTRFGNPIGLNAITNTLPQPNSIQSYRDAKGKRWYENEDTGQHVPFAKPLIDQPYAPPQRHVKLAQPQYRRPGTNNIFSERI